MTDRRFPLLPREGNNLFYELSSGRKLNSELRGIGGYIGSVRSEMNLRVVQTQVEDLIAACGSGQSEAQGVCGRAGGGRCAPPNGIPTWYLSGTGMPGTLTIVCAVSVPISRID